LTHDSNPAHHSGMHSINVSHRGGRRVGAGRPKGSGRYGEPTVPVRVPVTLVAEVEAFVRKAKRKLPLFVMGKSSEISLSGA
jgi:hypothetical protein